MPTINTASFPGIPNRRPALLLLAITLLAASLRIHAIGVALYGDEATSFSFYAFVPWHDLLFDYTDPNQHTLLIALSRLCMILLGENEIGFRLPSLLAGIFAVPMLYKLSLRLLDSQAAALTASGLLALSFYPLMYSQEGRSYSLTIFLACAVLYAMTKLIKEENPKGWRLGLVVLGLCMILALPSNAYFLAGASAFFVLEYWRKRGSLKSLLRPDFFRALAPILILFALMFAYFYVIASGLRKSLIFSQYFFKDFKDHGLRLDWVSFTSFWGYLSEPWGSWIYLFFAYGLVVLGREKRLPSFLMLFLIPATLFLSSRLVAPSRAFLYWEPFILFGIAVGIVGFVSDITKQLSRALKIVIPAVIIVTLLIPPTLKLPFYYQEKIDISGVTTADAKRIIDYLKGKEHRIIVYQNQVLTHWIGQLVMDNFFSVLRDGKLDDIIFITTRNIVPEKFRLIRDETNLPTPFTSQSFKLLEKIGDVRIHRLKVKISNFAPLAPNPDFEGIFPSIDNPSFTLSQIESPKVLGRYSLSAKNNSTDTNFGVLGPAFSMSADADENFLLLIYAKKHNDRAVIDITRDRSEIYWLDYRNSVFTLEDNRTVWHNILPLEFQHFMAGLIEFYPEALWEMKMALYPISKGDHQIIPQIVLGKDFYNNTGTFDALQMYHLKQ